MCRDQRGRRCKSPKRRAIPSGYRATTAPSRSAAFISGHSNNKEKLLYHRILKPFRESMTRRREFLKSCSAGAAVSMAGSAAAAGPGAVVIDPKPLFEISPRLYMQFMEPLGSND